MLAALKPQLLAETALEVSHLREKEFKYYESHISMLQTYATLLAGFAFATFVSVSEPLSTSALLFKAASGDYDAEGLDQATATIEQEVHKLDPMEMYTFGMHVIEVGSITLCLGENLFVLQVSLAATILGNRLALRGPAGSLNRAIELMARALKRGIDRFVLGLQWFMLSIVFHALKVLHPVSSVMVTLIIFSVWNKTHKTIRDIAIAFRLDSEDVVVAAFPDTPSGSEWPGGGEGGAGEQQAGASGAPAVPGTPAAASAAAATRNRQPGGGGGRHGHHHVVMVGAPVSVERVRRQSLFALTSAWSAVTEVEQKVEAAIRRQPESAAQHLVRKHQERESPAHAHAHAHARADADADAHAPRPVDIETGGYGAAATAEQLAALADIEASGRAQGGAGGHGHGCGQVPHASCAPAIVRAPSSPVGPLMFGWRMLRGQGL